MLEFGVVLQGRYRIQRRIGGGGMGVVYLADDTRLAGRLCAVKEMSPAELAPGDRNWAIQAFRQETQMLANLHHPGFTNVTGFFPAGGNWYLVMKYIQLVDAAYDQLFRDFQGTPGQMSAYHDLDRARIALAEGRFADVDAALAAFRSTLDS